MQTPSAGKLNIIPAGALQKICTRLNSQRATILEDLLNTICPTYGINSANIMHEFLANLCEECEEFTHYEESLNYSTPEHIQKTWPHRFPTLADAIPYVKQPQKLAEKVYGMRADLGNTMPGDGWAFRGSGPIQLTGRGIVSAFSTYMVKKFGIKKMLAEWADALRTQEEWGIHSACWFFAIAKQLIDEAEHDQMKTIILRINGGLNGYSDRMHYYNLCQMYIPMAG